MLKVVEVSRALISKGWRWQLFVRVGQRGNVGSRSWNELNKIDHR